MANPGEQMAKAVDGEYANLREYQEEIQKMSSDRQILMQQQTCNTK